ncbi:MAG: helix-hairpin-helix domain-containing protein [Sedimenticola sp.]
MASISTATMAIRVNFATVSDLIHIPGVGPALAKTIVNLREQRGNWTLTTLESLLRVRFDGHTVQMLDFAENIALPADDHLPTPPMSQHRVDRDGAGLEEQGLDALSDAGSVDSYEETKDAVQRTLQRVTALLKRERGEMGESPILPGQDGAGAIPNLNLDSTMKQQAFSGTRVTTNPIRIEAKPAVECRLPTNDEWVREGHRLLPNVPSARTPDPRCQDAGFGRHTQREMGVQIACTIIWISALAR